MIAHQIYSLGRQFAAGQLSFLGLFLIYNEV